MTDRPPVRLTERGWYVVGLAVAVLAFGVWWRYSGLLVLGSALAGLVLIDLVAASRPGRLRVRRVVEPLRVARHGRCAATLEIVHTGRRWSTIVDGAETVADELVPVPATWLRPGRPVEIGYPVPSHTRGLRTVGPTRLRRLGPAGLLARTETVGDEVGVLVVPRVLPVRAVPAGARRGQTTTDERVARGGTDLVGMHEYVPGDDLRHVHWAASARTGSLMVRDDADPSHAELTVVLDDQAASYLDSGFEDAVEVAAALTAAASAAGHPVRLRTVSGRVDVTHAGTGAATGIPAPELLVVLAGLTLVEPDPGGGSADQPAGPMSGTSYDLDVVALVSGAQADPASLALSAGRAEFGVVLIVGPPPAGPVRSFGSVLVLTGSRTEELLSLWDNTIVDGAS